MYVAMKFRNSLKYELAESFDKFKFMSVYQLLLEAIAQFHV